MFKIWYGLAGPPAGPMLPDWAERVYVNDETGTQSTIHSSMVSIIDA